MARATTGRKGRPKFDDEMDITPMIDVVFLLLIFFMVTSTMQDPSALQIPKARNGAGVSTRDSVVITIFKSDLEPEIFLADGERKNGPVPVEDVTRYVEEGIKTGKTSVIIKADRAVPSGFVEDVARAANEIDGVQGFWVGVEDKPSG